MKKTWQIINEIRGKSIRNIKPLFKYEDDIITDKKEIANKFNEYYAYMAENMNNSVNDEIGNSREILRHFKAIWINNPKIACTLAIVRKKRCGQQSEISKTVNRATFQSN